MIALLVFVGLFLVWPRLMLYFVAAPFLGAILGAFVWCMFMFTTGFSAPLSTIGAFVVGGMLIALMYSIYWANKNNI